MHSMHKIERQRLIFMIGTTLIYTRCLIYFFGHMFYAKKNLGGYLVYYNILYTWKGHSKGIVLKFRRGHGSPSTYEAQTPFRGLRISVGHEHAVDTYQRVSDLFLFLFFCSRTRNRHVRDTFGVNFIIHETSVWGSICKKQKQNNI